MLDLPHRWVLPTVEFPKGCQSVALVPGNHWFDFAGLFGEVLDAQLVLSQDPSTVHLLVRFRTAQGAHAMFEALTERYLYNPQNRNVDDTHPVTSSVGRFEDLLDTCRGLKSSASSEGGYILRRCGNAEDKKAGPDAIAITPTRRRLVVGREGCDVILKRMHVSKAHATLELHSRADGASWTLTIQDTSANGTWVNSAQLVPNQPLELRVGDRISFLPADHEFYPDALMYEVALLRPGDKVGASTGLLSSTQGTQQGNFAQSRPLTSLMSRSESDPTLRARPGRPVSSDIFIERP